MSAACLVLTVAACSGVGADQPKAPNAAFYVEFDFSNLPGDGEGMCTLTLTVLTADKDLKYVGKMEGPKRGFNPESTCAFYEDHMKDGRFKVEIVGKTKLRVYGRTWNGELIPATEGKVESPDLTKDQLPKVKNPTT